MYRHPLGYLSASYVRSKNMRSVSSAATSCLARHMVYEIDGFVAAPEAKVPALASLRVDPSKDMMAESSLY